jgi:hypothetical protein
MDNKTTGCSLAELVEDPLISLLMKSDGVDRRGLEVLLERVARERSRAVQGSQPPQADEATRCPSC